MTLKCYIINVIKREKVLSILNRQAKILLSDSFSSIPTLIKFNIKKNTILQFYTKITSSPDHDYSDGSLDSCYLAKEKEYCLFSTNSLKCHYLLLLF